MNLADQFEDGFLVEGPLVYQVDEKVVREPWPCSLEDLRSVFRSDRSRQSLLGHLEELVSWIDDALADDEHRRVWVRGDLVAASWSNPEELDVVLHYDPNRLSRSNHWVLTVLSAGPVALHPGRLKVTALDRTVPWYQQFKDQEAIRSRVRVHDHVTGDAYATGWIEIANGGG